MYCRGIFLCILAALLQVSICAPSYETYYSFNDDLDLQNDQVGGFNRVKREGVGTSSKKPIDNKPKVTSLIDSDGKDKSKTIGDMQGNNKKESKNGDAAAAAVTKGSSSITDDVASPTPTMAAVVSGVGKEDQEFQQQTEKIQAPGKVDNRKAFDLKDWKNLREAMLFFKDGPSFDDNESNDDDNAEVGMDAMMHRCSRVRCTPPPNGFLCKGAPIEVTESIPQLIGLTSECCPIHICGRNDGSTFLHYAIEVDDDSSQPPRASYSSSYSVSGNGNNNIMPLLSQRSDNSHPFMSPMFPPIFPFYPSSSQYSSPSSNKQISSSSSSNAPPSSLGLIFPPRSDRFTFPSSSSSLQIVLPPSQNSNKYPSPSAGIHGLSQMHVSDSPLVSLDRIVRNVGFGGSAPIPRFDSGPYGAGPMMGDNARSRRDSGFGNNNWPASPAGIMPNRPGPVPFN